MSRVRSQKTLNTKKASPEDVWTRCGSLFEDPKKAYLHLLHNTQAGALILDEWEKVFNRSKNSFLIYFVNNPYESEDSLKLCEGTVKQLRHTLQSLGISKSDSIEITKTFNVLIRDPSVIRESRISPPTLVVWHDGDLDGDCVSQFVAFAHISNVLPSVNRLAIFGLEKMPSAKSKK